MSTNYFAYYQHHTFKIRFILETIQLVKESNMNENIWLINLNMYIDVLDTASFCIGRVSIFLFVHTLSV